VNEAAASTEWRRQPERGSAALLRAMAWLSLHAGRRAVLPLLHATSLYYLLFAPRAARHMRIYLRRALGREPRILDRYRLIFSFASAILDRLFLLAGRCAQYRISIEGEELIREVAQSGGGAMLLGAHMGSFEVLRAIGGRQPGLAVAMAMYEENARKVNAVMAAACPRDPPEIIALGHLDAMLRIRERLDQGVLVGMLADRSLGEEPARQVRFLGHEARFPLGPMHMAALLRQRVLFMAGLRRGGNSYHLIFAPLADFRTMNGDRAAAVAAAVDRYVGLLERYCRSDPYNWFNFFDFWAQQPGAGIRA
jgi:predicted LPLAT superfamily acyltransferase